MNIVTYREVMNIVTSECPDRREDSRRGHGKRKDLSGRYLGTHRTYFTESNTI